MEGFWITTANMFQSLSVLEEVRDIFLLQTTAFDDCSSTMQVHLRRLLPSEATAVTTFRPMHSKTSMGVTW